MPSTGLRKIERDKIVILTGAGGDFIADVRVVPLSAMSPILAFGAKFTTRAFRFWKAHSQHTRAGHRGHRGTCPRACTQTTRYLQV